jgi:Rhs element Vgr protein
MTQILQESPLPVSLSIKINGKAIKDTIEIESVFVSKEVNRISYAKLKVLDGGVFGSVNEKFINSEGVDFIPGNEVKIDMGYGDKRETVFEGIIISQRLLVKKNNSYLEITCKDKAVILTKGRFTNVYTDATDSDTFGKIASKFGLQKDIDSTTVTFGQLVQHYCSYWDFILMRAEMNNQIVITENNQLKIKDIDLSSSPLISIQADMVVLEADMDIDAEDIVKEFNVVSWDESSQQIASATSNVTDSLNLGNITTQKLSDVLSGITSNRLSSASLTKEELQNIGKSAANRVILNKIKGRIQVSGTSKVSPGDIVELKGFNQRYNGNAFVSKVIQEMEEGDWITSLYIGMSSRFHSSLPDLEEHDAGGNLPAAKGLLIGKVAAIHGDPDANYRVKITMPSFKGEAEEYVWARMTFDYASNQCGFFFYPEIGDEVLVGFVHNDPRFPVIMGGLYSKKNKPKEEPDEKNQFKSIVTKSGISIKFDDEDKILTIQTPGGNKLVMNDKDKMIEAEDINGNKLTLNESGISMDSPKDIKISAKGKINLDAIGELGISSKADIVSKGLNVSLEAQVGFKAKGNASAELSASGQTIVKGAMVMIN